MGDFVNKLAKELKKFENHEQIGSLVGKVIKPYPDLTISILSGQVILYPEQLYVNEHLTNEYIRKYEETGKITLDAKTESAMAGVTGQATESPTGHAHDIKLNENTYTSKGDIKLTDTLKAGDFVKVSPMIDGQLWFVDYKVKKVK